MTAEVSNQGTKVRHSVYDAAHKNTRGQRRSRSAVLAAVGRIDTMRLHAYAVPPLPIAPRGSPPISTTAADDEKSAAGPMGRVEASVVIGRAVDDVFRFMNDQTHAPLWQQGTITSECLGAGPIGAGTNGRSEVKIFGRPVVWQSSASGTPIFTTWKYDEVSEGTRVTFGRRCRWRLAVRRQCLGASRARSSSAVEAG